MYVTYRPWTLRLLTPNLRFVPDDVRLRLGRAVRGERQRRGLSQEELAELAGLDRTYISGLERGTRNPALTTQHKVADALGVPLADLLALAATEKGQP